MLAELIALEDLRLRGLGGADERQPHMARRQDAEVLEQPFRRGRIRLGEDEVDQRVQLVVKPLGRLQVACVEAARELGDGARRDVGDCADQPRAAQRERRQAEQLDAAPDERVATTVMEDVGDVLEVLRRLLDPDDVVVLAHHPCQRLGRDVDSCADRDVVGDDRQIGIRRGDGAVPLDERILVGRA